MPEFVAARDSGAHGSWNMSRVPLCIADGVEIGQGKAIGRYIAKSHALMGSSLVEEAQIDTICEHVAEMGDAHKKLSTDEEKAAWFTTLPEPAAGAGARDKSHRQLRWYLGHLENCVGEDGNAIGGAPSLADAAIYSKLGETDDECGDRGKIMGNTDSARNALEGFPKLVAIVAAFGSSAGMQKWLATRGPQGF